MSEHAVSILEQRRIEARFAAGLLATLEKELGAERARSLLRQAITELARQTGAAMAAQSASAARGQAATLEDLAEILPLWQKDDGITIQWLEKGRERLSFNVTRCRYAESYRELGLGALGDTLSCNRDGEFCRGYNPAIRLERTQTIMGGAKFCDFRYTLADAPAGEAPPA